MTLRHDADAADRADDDQWLAQLRTALQRPVDEVATDAGDDHRPMGAVAMSPPAADPPVSVEAPLTQAVDLEPVLVAIERLEAAISGLADRVDTMERDQGGPPALVDQESLDSAVADAVRQATMRAQATGAGTTRLEAEVRVLEDSVGTLSKRIAELNVTALARDRLEKDVHVERLAGAAEAVQQQLAASATAQQAFRDGVRETLDQARAGDGQTVAWTDVMLLTHELRSRIDDLEDQQRRALRDLTEWQVTADDQLASLRTAMLSELRRLLAEAGP